MAVLKPEEYDMSYFDGRKGSYAHNAGYSEYKRWRRFEGKDSLGEFFKDIANRLKNDFQLQGKRVLELGCAYGFMVEDLREMGVDAWGIDVSQYAYDQASKKVKPYLKVADARTDLKKYKTNEFEVIFSRWFLGGIDDNDLPNLIAQMNRIARLQIHIISEDILPRFYNRKPIAEWVKLNFKKGTILSPTDDMSRMIRK